MIYLISVFKYFLLFSQDIFTNECHRFFSDWIELVRDKAIDVNNCFPFTLNRNWNEIFYNRVFLSINFMEIKPYCVYSQRKWKTLTDLFDAIPRFT